MEAAPPPASDSSRAALDIVEAHLKFLTQKPLDETLAGLTDFERAKYKTVLAYALTTLQLCYLRSKGESIENHPNLRHLERIRTVFTKIDKYIDLSEK
jgi:hypothetical protein